MILLIPEPIRLITVDKWWCCSGFKEWEKHSPYDNLVSLSARVGWVLHGTPPSFWQKCKVSDLRPPGPQCNNHHWHHKTSGEDSPQDCHSTFLLLHGLEADCGQLCVSPPIQLSKKRYTPPRLPSCNTFCLWWWASHLTELRHRYSYQLDWPLWLTLSVKTVFRVWI